MVPVLKILIKISAVVLCVFLYAQIAHAQSWQVEEFRFRQPDSTSVKVAPLYMPRAAARVSAFVMVISSSSVMRWIKGYYVSQLARSGAAVLILDDFKPDELRDVIEPHSLRQLEAEALYAVTQLQNDGRIDPVRISIMGISDRSPADTALATRSMRQINTISLVINPITTFACDDQLRYGWSPLEQYYKRLMREVSRRFQFCF